MFRNADILAKRLIRVIQRACGPILLILFLTVGEGAWAQQAAGDSGNSLVVSVRKDGSFFVRGQKITHQLLTEMIQGLARKDPSLDITVEALKGATSEHINKVIAAAKGAGIIGYSFIASDSEEPDNTAPTPAAPGALVSLEDTSGRTIKAHIIDLTDTKVSVRVAGGKQFEIPLANLTADTVRRLREEKPVAPAKQATPVIVVPAGNPALPANPAPGNTSQKERPEPFQMESSSGKSVDVHVLSLSETHVSFVREEGAIFTLPLADLTPSCVERLRSIKDELPMIDLFAVYSYYIWRPKSGAVAREAGGQMTFLPVNFVCKGTPIEIGSSFQLIEKNGEEYVGHAFQATGKSFSKEARGKVTIMHMDFNREYSGKGVAQAWLIDANTKAQVSNRVTFQVDLK